MVSKDNLEDELIRLIRFSIETAGISPNEICVLAPQWVHLASMTRRSGCQHARIFLRLPCVHGSFR